MKTNIIDVMFLLFYVPLFFVKLLDFDSSTYTLKILAIACFCIFVMYLVITKRYKNKEFLLWLVGGSFLSLLVITCGKQGALFSFISMILMRYSHITRNRSILFYVGIIGMLLCLYMKRDAREAIRYINGDIVSIIKRSNIAFISFFAVVNLYLITYKTVSNKVIAVLAVLSYLSYSYTGCRTGIVCSAILLTFLFIFKSQIIRKSIVVKIVALCSPTICMVGSIAMVQAYNMRYDWAVLLNRLLQGRLRLGSLFMSTYSPKLFGQKIAENFSSSNFLVLDSAYLDMFLCYGVLFTLLWIVFTTLVINWLFFKKNYIGVAVIISYSIYGITETFLPNCFLNPSLLLYGEYLVEKFKLGIDCSKPIYFTIHPRRWHRRMMTI